MKKLLVNFRKVVAAAIVASMTLAASCAYDDSAIRKDINNIKQDVTELTERISDLEERFTEEVGALQSLLDGKLLVTEVTTDENGFTVINLSDGSKVTVLARDKALQYRITDGVLEVSADGQNWGALGVAPECVVAEVVVNDDNTVTLTLANGEKVTVAMAELIEFNVKSKLFVAAGMSKSVTFNAGEGVSDVYVMDEPLGWDAVVEGNTLTVTAPSREVVALGAAKKSGVVTLHLNSAAGACKVAKLAVEMAELKLTIDKEGNFEVRNSVVDTYERTNEYWQMVEVTDFVPWEIVLLPYANYTGDLAYDIQNSMSVVTANGENLTYIDGINYPDTHFEEGVTEEFVCTGTIRDLVNGLTYGGMEYDNQSFVVAVAPMNLETFVAMYDEAAIAEFIQPSLVIDVTETTWKSAMLNVTLFGYEEYFVVYEATKNITNADTYYSELLAMYDSMGEFGIMHLTEDYSATNVSLDTFLNYNASYVMDYTLAPDTEYEIAVLAIEEGKETYSVDDIVRVTFTTDPIAKAETPAEIKMTAKTDFTSIRPTVTIPDNAVALYWNWDDKITIPTEEESVVEALVNGAYKLTNFEGGYTISHGGEYYLSNWDITYNLTPGQSKVMQVVVVDTDGNYTFSQTRFQTKKVVVNEQYTLSVGVLQFVNGNLNVPVEGLDGADITKYRYYMMDVDNWALKHSTTIKNEIATSTDIYYIDITGDDISNPLIITSGYSGYGVKALAAGTTYRFGLVAIFADGSVSNAIVVDEVTYEMTLIKSTDPEYEANKPTLNIDKITYDPEYNSWYIDFSFDIPDGVTMVYAAVFDPEYIANQAGRSAKVSYVVDNCAYTDTSGVYTELYVGFKHYNIYYTWVDAAGNYYEVATYELKADLDTTL